MLQNLKKALATTTRSMLAGSKNRTRAKRRNNGRLTLEPLESRQMLNAGPLEISEFMAVNNSALRDGDGEYVDWIEIHNPTAATEDITGWHLTDDAAVPGKWTFPATTIAAGDYLIVFADGDDLPDPADNPHTNFNLDGDGDYLALMHPDATMVSYAYTLEYPFEYPEQAIDSSYGLLDGQKQFLGFATPGKANDTPRAVITEFMAVNNTTLQDEDAAYSDWIEVYNPTDAPVNLDGWRLTDDAGDLAKWTFPDTDPDTTVELGCNEERFQLAA